MSRPATASRVLQILNAALYLLGLAAIVVVANLFAQRPWLRMQLDATKTRAYSLSEQTRRLLSSLTGQWTIALILSEDRVDRATRRQVDEVLKRFTEATDAIHVVRIDPTSLASLRDYEQLLARLRTIYAGRISAYDRALDQGAEALGDLRIFAQQQAGPLLAFVESLPAEFDGRDDLQARAQLLAILSGEGGAVVDEVNKARRIDEGRPIPDYETARSILAEGLGQWAQELFEVARTLERWQEEPGAPSELRRFAAAAGESCERMSQRLATAADPLKRLLPLELSEIGRQLQQGETAVVLSPDRASVIPSTQLFAQSGVQNVGTTVRFDRRFRGEQLIASTVRALLSEHMPMVVFVHAEDGSLLQAQDRDADLVGVAAMLQASRFEVVEWIVPQAERPSPDPEQPVVWVVVPPIRRASLEPAEAELSLVEAARTLIAEGESVLLNVNPSLLPGFRRADPWMDLGRPFGLHVDTSRVICEATRVGENEVEVQRGQTVNRYPDDHPIARAVQGQQSYFNLPVAVRVGEQPAGTVLRVLARVEPSSARWLETEWARPEPRIEPPPLEERLGEEVAVMMAAERPDPVSRGGQRLILVGSGGWMLSFVADVAVNVGGDRFALVNPGNHELLLSSVAWLAHRDELIAPSPASREAARLRDLSDGVRQSWFWIAVALVPGACLGLGLVVWFRRRG